MRARKMALTKYKHSMVSVDRSAVVACEVRNTVAQQTIKMKASMQGVRRCVLNDRNKQTITVPHQNLGASAIIPKGEKSACETSTTSLAF